MLIIAAGCASYDPPCPTPSADETSGPLDAVVFVAGDAGGPVRESLQVLEPLKDEVARAVRELGADRTVVVFTGDNVYPAGLPRQGHPYRAEAERRLDAQLALAETGAVVRFVPGNHDWNHWRSGGIAAVTRQTEYVARASGNVRLVPGNGCPGPVRLDVGERLRLLFVDTQFWLHTAEPVEPNACTPGTQAAALAELRAEVDTPRQVVVVAHHPLRSGGPHGGWFGWRAWLFPPVPLARLLGLNVQDLPAPRYRRAARELCGATARDNVLWAAGHEHNLQFFERDGRCPASLVSGNGMADHASPVRVLPRMRACSTAPGWVRVDVPREGAPRVSLRTITARVARMGNP